MTDTQQAAQRWLDRIIADLDDPNEVSIGDGSGTYATTKNRAESYMIGGGGPGAWLWFIFKTADESTGPDEIDEAFMQWIGFGETELVRIPSYEQRRLLAACRKDAAIRDSHG